MGNKLNDESKLYFKDELNELTRLRYGNRFQYKKFEDDLENCKLAMKVGYVIEKLLTKEKKVLSINLPSHTMTCIGIGKNEMKHHLLFMNSWEDDYINVLGNSQEIDFPFSDNFPFNNINSGYSILFKWFVYMNAREILFFDL